LYAFFVYAFFVSDNVNSFLKMTFGLLVILKQYIELNQNVYSYLLNCSILEEIDRERLCHYKCKELNRSIISKTELSSLFFSINNNTSQPAYFRINYAFISDTVTSQDNCWKSLFKHFVSTVDFTISRSCF